MGIQAQPKIPVIDFCKEDLKPGTPAWLSACNEVKHALEEYGCFVALSNNTVSPELHQKVFQSSEELFDLPREIKAQNTYDKPYHGYVGHPAVPLHEGLGIDDSTALDAVQGFTNLMWPAGKHDFCENVHSYSKQVAELDRMVSRMIFESYGVESYHEAHVESTIYLLRFLKYRGPEAHESNLAFIPHTDKSFLTILHQNDVNGLEIETRDGNWIGYESPSPPISFVVMAGDALMAWSNGRVHSSSHRVVINGKKTRHTLGLFSFNNNIVRIPEEMVDQEHPLQYKHFNHYGLVHFYGSEEGKKLGHSVIALKAYCGI
ncbi:probable 2-oxoglutarate-dependent dioxygenase AOP1 [Malania oleifera]|uniref:probable 2-oxoglutarate-dependent dioxygenase AOP1 n=1 Tax=Malania oleifera TaxID=397392 RepID=UPI0025ADD8A4|nr:probable 2-oxoglutarate-dependent dioxygenase AOP1 [Malania oleifera]